MRFHETTVEKETWTWTHNIKYTLSQCGSLSELANAAASQQQPIGRSANLYVAPLLRVLWFLALAETVSFGATTNRFTANILTLRKDRKKCRLQLSAVCNILTLQYSAQRDQVSCITCLLSYFNVMYCEYRAIYYLHWKKNYVRLAKLPAVHIVCKRNYNNNRNNRRI